MDNQGISDDLLWRIACLWTASTNTKEFEALYPTVNDVRVMTRKFNAGVFDEEIKQNDKASVTNKDLLSRSLSPGTCHGDVIASRPSIPRSIAQYSPAMHGYRLQLRCSSDSPIRIGSATICRGAEFCSPPMTMATDMLLQMFSIVLKWYMTLLRVLFFARRAEMSAAISSSTTLCACVFCK
jgi:hypothetical protein